LSTYGYSSPGQLARRRLILGLAALAGAVVAASACARPAGLDLSRDRLSDHGVFRVALSSRATPIPLFRTHSWSVRLTTPRGDPVSGASLAIDGGMPEHHHGLPTSPKVVADSSPGDYVVNGMKFSMPGWWNIRLAITTPEGLSDTITFNVVL